MSLAADPYVASRWLVATLEELDYGDEIRGVVCPHCGGSLVWNKGRAHCDEDGPVEPVAEQPIPYGVLSDEDYTWLHINNMEDDYDG